MALYRASFSRYFISIGLTPFVLFCHSCGCRNPDFFSDFLDSNESWNDKFGYSAVYDYFTTATVRVENPYKKRAHQSEGLNALGCSAPTGG